VVRFLGTEHFVKIFSVSEQRYTELIFKIESFDVKFFTGIQNGDFYCAQCSAKGGLPITGDSFFRRVA
jgi:hypothetical protein